jgi:hypothetical protein
MLPVVIPVWLPVPWEAWLTGMACAAPDHETGAARFPLPLMKPLSDRLSPQAGKSPLIPREGEGDTEPLRGVSR